MPYGDQTSAALARRSQWDKRIKRAADLAKRFGYAAEVLTFYAEVLKLQRTIYNQIASQSPASTADGMPFRIRLKPEDVAQHLPALLSLAEAKGTAKLAEEAGAIRATSSAQQIEMLGQFLAGEPSPQAFFARALLQPYAECLAQAYPAPLPGTAPSGCPVCGGRPQAAVLRPEGDGGKRFLLCAFCLTEWEFRRVLCAICGEEDYRKLPRYTAEEHDSVRVEACDTCHFYLKSIDMTIDGLAAPLVDEVATVPLDLWATEHGYKKAEPNLMGF